MLNIKNLFVSAAIALAAMFVPQMARATTLYAVNETTDELVAINTDTITFNIIGSLGADFKFGGLAYDANSSTMYMVPGWTNNNVSNNLLYTVNIETGAATLVGEHGVNSLFGLAFDTTNNVLYGTQNGIVGCCPSGGTDLYSIDTSTGASTLVATMNRDIDGLAYDSTNDRLVGLTSGVNSVLYEINRTTGQQVALHPSFAFVNNNGLAYDPLENLFWSVTADHELVSYANNRFSPVTFSTGDFEFVSLAAVTQVPLPAALPLFGTGLGIMAFIGWRRRRRMAAEAA